jgi:three-Cys-motif partner protein
MIGAVIDQIVSRSLTLAFIDPEGLDARFETIQRLTSNRAVDLLILFPDAMDISRNVERYYLPNRQSKLDEFLGPRSGWRDEWQALGNVEGERAREFFAKIYMNQLKTQLGYKQFGQRVMKWDRGPLYRLIYASRSEVGLKFWHEVLKKDVGGQRELF